jgi:hypothetical protein
MEPTHITCTRVEEEDLDARYLAGTLSEEEAEAFEEHYFGCERCWAAVQLGLDVRAASDDARRGPDAQAPALSVERGPQARPRSLPDRRWWPIAIAASIAVVALAVWQWDGRTGVIPVGDELRGPADSIHAVAFSRGRTLVVAWPPKPAADRYGVRLQKGDATVIVERIIGDTSFAIPRDSLSGVAGGENVYWEIRALDALRRTIARSRLIPTRIPEGGR